MMNGNGDEIGEGEDDGNDDDSFNLTKKYKSSYTCFLTTRICWYSFEVLIPVAKITNVNITI